MNITKNKSAKVLLALSLAGILGGGRSGVRRGYYINSGYCYKF